MILIFSKSQKISDIKTPVTAAKAIPFNSTEPILIEAPLTPITKTTAPRTLLWFLLKSTFCIQELELR